MSRRLFGTPSRNTSRNSSRKLAAEIAKQMITVIPPMMMQLQQGMATTPTPQTRVASHDDTQTLTCTLKHFNSCKPPAYTGTEGATSLLQWFEGIENTFLNSDCPKSLRTRYAMSVLQKRALTWWNAEKRTRGAKAALSLSWKRVKKLMRKEFCPSNEVKKLEVEFWELKQDSGENEAYNTRFHELSQLVPHMATPVSRAIERYIGGLPMQIQDAVWGRNPKTLAVAIRLAAILTDNHVRAGTLTRKGSKKPKANTPTETSSEDEATPSPRRNHKKRKAHTQNYAVTKPTKPNVPTTQATPATPNKKPYIGPHPLCDICQYHHATTVPCRLCAHCGRYGHLVNTCRQLVQPPAQPVAQRNAPPLIYPRACYQCGSPNHLRNTCPELIQGNPAPAAQANPGARGRAAIANQIQVNNEVENAAV